MPTGVVRQLRILHRELDACRLCPRMVGPVVHGPPVDSKILLVGQAPGPHEGGIGKPFAWTAGKTLFKWLAQATGGADEATIRDRVYFTAVARCFPGKAKGGGDRRPDEDEILNCRRYLDAETKILEPELVIAVGAMAIGEVLGHTGKLDQIVGTVRRVPYHGVLTDVVALPHPSGASTWHRREPGIGLLTAALGVVGKHPAMQWEKKP
jgi:uracil-DNA glycosylase